MEKIYQYKYGGGDKYYAFQFTPDKPLKDYPDWVLESGVKIDLTGLYKTHNGSVYHVKPNNYLVLNLKQNSIYTLMEAHFNSDMEESQLTFEEKRQALANMNYHLIWARNAKRYFPIKYVKSMDAYKPMWDATSVCDTDLIKATDKFYHKIFVEGVS